MGVERAVLRRRAARHGPTAADYESNDTIASLAMGVASLLAPLVVPKLLRPITPGKGRFGKALVGAAVGAVAVTTIADAVATPSRRGRTTRPARRARKVGECRRRRRGRGRRASRSPRRSRRA